jgi:hypothetical protein
MFYESSSDPCEVLVRVQYVSYIRSLLGAECMQRAQLYNVRLPLRCHVTNSSHLSWQRKTKRYIYHVKS